MKKIIINIDNRFGQTLKETLSKLGIDDKFITEYNKLYDIVKDDPNSMNYNTLELRYERIVNLIDIIKHVWDQGYMYGVEKANKQQYEISIK